MFKTSKTSKSSKMCKTSMTRQTKLMEKEEEAGSVLEKDRNLVGRLLRSKMCKTIKTSKTSALNEDTYLVWSNIIKASKMNETFSSLHRSWSRSRCYVQQFFLRQFLLFSSTIQEQVVFRPCFRTCHWSKSELIEVKQDNI